MEALASSQQHRAEVAAGQRFEFGANWARFLEVVNDERIDTAAASLKNMLGVPTLQGKSFLDAGSGSGLFSLAALRLGASVHSFDFDPQSVACTRELKRRYCDGDASWSVDEASVLDARYLRSLGQFDVVYSWGVLHHTGAMWTAIDNVVGNVNSGGHLYLMLYRDAHLAATWRAVKPTYARSPAPIQWLMRNAFAGFMVAGMLAKHRSIAKVRRSINGYGGTRGMSWYTDLTDWIGGYPFEYAEAEQVVEHLKRKGFTLVKISPLISPKASGWRGTGSYEYVFQRR